MVQCLVDGFRADPSLGIRIHHVDARFSDDLVDVGRARRGKVWRLFGYIREARRLGRSLGCRALYYVPTPPKRTPLYRDWIAMALLRPWFRTVVFHWHAVGLGRWLETDARAWERRLTHRWLDDVALSIVLSAFNREDVAGLRPRRVEIVPNGIPDPCSAAALEEVAGRRARWERVRAAGGELGVLFLALCSKDKGVLDAVEAVRLANRAVASSGGRHRFRLTVAGAFPDASVKEEFEAQIRAPELAGRVTVAGFLDASAKDRVMRESDLFLFPTYYASEGQPLNLIEAMAYGMPSVTTRWRAIPEIVGGDHVGLVEPRDPAAAAAALVRVMERSDPVSLRHRFEARYTVSRHLSRLAGVLGEVAGNRGPHGQEPAG